jgi:hypothetical protein
MRANSYSAPLTGGAHWDTDWITRSRMGAWCELRASKMRRVMTETRHGGAVGVPAALSARGLDRIACCVASSEARQVAVAAVRCCGGDAVAMPPLELVKALRHSGPWAGLIHDLNPWDREGLAQVVRVRREYPDLPILVYPPARVGVADLLVRCGALTGLRALLQRVAPEEIDRLHRLLVSLLAERPRARVLLMLRAMAPAAPPCAWTFAELALIRLSEGRGPAGLRVGPLARELGASERTLERASHRTALPPPKELLEWLALLLAAVSAVSAGTTVVGAARVLGIHARDLYRLRRRLLPGHTRARSLHPDQECDMVLLALAERCRDLEAVLRVGRRSATIA